jgi:hypothetical protein
LFGSAEGREFMKLRLTFSIFQLLESDCEEEGKSDNTNNSFKKPGFRDDLECSANDKARPCFLMTKGTEQFLL